MRRLVDKVAVVTGAGAGFGAQSARRFAAEGAKVVCADLDFARAEAVADEISQSGGVAVALMVEVASAQSNASMVEAAYSRFGRIDVLFANAGIAGAGTAIEVTEETWDRVLDVNLKSVWLAARSVLPGMIEQRSGSVIATASVGGLVGLRGVLPYAAAKGGVVAMIKQLAYDFSGQGIRFNAVCPGTVHTGLVEETYRERLRLGGSDNIDRDVAAGLMEMTSRYPAGRLGTVDDVASAALYLASDESSWVTGTAMVVDGGYTAV